VQAGASPASVHHPFFLPPGAEAYKRDLPNAEVLFLDTGHFVLVTHAAEIAQAIANSLGY
jgi:pimeloyl-ACP methyl ester carboxylesterase